MKVALATLGCKLNQADTEAIREAFERAGWEVSPFGDEADVYVVNTCTVTAGTDHQSRQLLRRALKRKALRPGVRVVATGCYAQTDSAGLAASAPGIDLLVGNLDKERIPELLDRLSSAPRLLVRDVAGEKTFRQLPIGKFACRTRAFLRVQEGCDRRCAYCIVPLARGRERSAPLEDALTQARRFADNGHLEIVVTGIHIGRYGNGLENETTLAKLLLRLSEIEGLRRIRLSSIDPKEFSDALFDALDAIREKLCPHFHISLQSGDDTILRAMRRDYTAAEFSSRVARLRGLFPDVCIGADVIAGFPGESDMHFEKTYRLIEELELSYMHVFRFSPRPGTAAAEMPDHVPEDVKKERSARLLALRRRLNEAFRSRFIGRELEVLFETRRDKAAGRLTGLTRNYIRVLADGPDELMGSLATALPDSLTHAGLSAKIVNTGLSE